MDTASKIDILDVARVVSSGVTAYLLVHVILLPYLVKMGISFPAYFYIGVIATAVLSVAISYLIRPRGAHRDRASQASAMHPAE